MTPSFRHAARRASLFAAAPLLLSTAAVVVAAAVNPANAQTRTADPIKRGLQLTDFPRFVKLAENVYGYEEIRSPGFTTVSLVVIGTKGVLVADGQGSAQATQTMLDKIKTLTTQPVKWYVVGSDHGDHTAGNSVLPPDITYIISPASKAILDAAKSRADSATERAASEAKAKGTAAPAARYAFAPATAMKGNKETIDVGGISVDVLNLGRAHTGGDLLVHLPRESVLFMSEVYLNRVFPAMRSAYPSEWVATIDKALAMNVKHYIPGHGFIETPAVSREELLAFKDATKAVIAEVTRLRKLGLSADDAIKQANWGPYKDWFIADQQGPIAVRKVFEELDGKLR